MKHIHAIILCMLLGCTAMTGQTVIAIEKGSVYIDATDAQVGDSYFVYPAQEYFVHPVTGEKIPKGEESIATVKVVHVYDGYCETVPVPDIHLTKIKEGMLVRKMNIGNKKSKLL